MKAHIHLFNKKLKKLKLSRDTDPLVLFFLGFHGEFLGRKLVECERYDFEGKFPRMNTVNSMHELLQGKQLYLIGRTGQPSISREDYEEAKAHGHHTLMDMKECNVVAVIHHGKRVIFKCKDSGEKVVGVVNFDHLDRSGFIGVNHHNGKVSWWKIRVDAMNVDLIVDERSVYAIRELSRLGYPLVVPFESAKVLKRSSKRSIDSVGGKKCGRTMIKK